MLKLLKADSYRLLRKTSLYLYLGGLAAGYFLLAFVRSGGFDADSITSDAFNLFSFLPALVGGYLFASTYTDDLGSRGLATLAASGISRAHIILARLACMAIFSTAVFAATPLWLYAVHALLGWPASAATAAVLYALAAKQLLATLAYASLASIAAYGLQRPTAAMLLYVLLSLNTVGSLAGLLLTSLVGPEAAALVTSHLVQALTDRLLAGLLGLAPLVPAAIEYAAWLAASALAATLALQRKEIEP